MAKGNRSLLMRLLLIMALLGASIGLGPAASARTTDTMSLHHAQMEHGDHQHRGHHGNHDEGNPHAVMHVCPGCAVFGSSTASHAPAAPLTLPRLPADPLSLRSLQTNPIPPPPRMS